MEGVRPEFALLHLRQERLRLMQERIDLLKERGAGTEHLVNLVLDHRALKASIDKEIDDANFARRGNSGQRTEEPK